MKNSKFLIWANILCILLNIGIIVLLDLTHDVIFILLLTWSVWVQMVAIEEIFRRLL